MAGEREVEAVLGVPAREAQMFALCMCVPGPGRRVLEGPRVVPGRVSVEGDIFGLASVQLGRW